MRVELLHLCDSLFPIGSFGYSDGLESATADGNVATAGDLGAWLEVCLDDTIARTEGPAVRRAWIAIADGDWDRVVALDEELTAFRPASSTRRSSRAMGRRLVTTWQELHPDVRLEELRSLMRAGRAAPTLPVAFAAASLCAGVDVRSSMAAFAYTRLAATISAAMRLMAIGQSDAHALLARTLTRVPAAVADIVDRDAEVESFAPAMDIAAMNHRYVHSRLFRS